MCFLGVGRDRLAVPSGTVYGAIAVAVLAIPLAAALLVRAVGGLALRPWPEWHAALERHWLWAIVPATAAFLVVVGAWPFAILWALVSPLAVMLLKRIDYFGTKPRST
jgi:hypothetical protein